MAYIHYTNRFGAVQLVPNQLFGLTLYELRLPGRAEGLLARRCLRRGVELLERTGCRRLLAPCPLSPGCKVLHTRALWQAVAGRLAVAALERRGIQPNQAVVGIRADRLSRNLIRCCTWLAPRVRGLALSSEAERLLGWELERLYGLPLAEGGAELELSFLPGDSGENRYCLGDLDPAVPGFTLDLPGLELPEACPRLPVLAALLEEGRIPAADLVLLDT